MTVCGECHITQSSGSRKGVAKWSVSPVIPPTTDIPRDPLVGMWRQVLTRCGSRGTVRLVTLAANAVIVFTGSQA